MIVTDKDIELFLKALKANSEYDFTDYSEKSFKRRITKVLTDNRMSLDTMLEEIRHNKDFTEKIIREITVNTTELFRDPVVWQALKSKVLMRFHEYSSFNIWHAGCSTGQEVYSFCILLNEMGLLNKARIYATDINSEVLDMAKKGVYKYKFNVNYLENFDKVIRENPAHPDQLLDIPYEKYFHIDKERDTIQMNDFLLQKPIFRKHDLVRQENIFYVKFDIIFCRNVIIYFNYDLQNKVFNLFSDNLFQGGSLVLGVHETILGPLSNNFNKHDQFYFRK